MTKMQRPVQFFKVSMERHQRQTELHSSIACQLPGEGKLPSVEYYWVYQPPSTAGPVIRCSWLTQSRLISFVCLMSVWFWLCWIFFFLRERSNMKSVWSEGGGRLGRSWEKGKILIKIYAIESLHIKKQTEAHTEECTDAHTEQLFQHLRQ